MFLLFIQVLLELLVDRLFSAATFSPMSAVIHFERILNEVAVIDAPRLARSVSLYLSQDSAVHSLDEEKPLHLKKLLLALHALSASIRRLKAPVLLDLLPSITPTILALFGSASVDLRKAVVYALVEAYVVLGDALMPFVSGLQPSQKKLLTIYIERQLKQQRQASSLLVL